MAASGSFAAFSSALEGGKGAVKALVVPGAAEKYSRKMIEALEETAKIYKAKGLAWMKVAASGELEGGISKFFTDKSAGICGKLGAKAGDLILFVADARRKTACVALGAVRSQLGKELKLADPDEFHFAWIVDFPMFAWNEDENKWETEHHMFTMPQKKYWPTLESDPGSVKGDLYDLVMNGYEIASGSIRINDPELQKRIFRIVGYDEERGKKAFGFLTEAFRYGAPPHGGIAPGLDRLLMLMCHEDSIREVIAFPKNTFAQSPMDGCPSGVDDFQLKELHIAVTEHED
jgi:aspartyl-tRNA synthetase